MAEAKTTKVTTLTDSAFNDAVKNNAALVVDMYADWCGPCKQAAPMLEELAGEYSGRVSFAKVNVDNNPRAAQTFGVQAIPTFLFFKDGQLVDRVTGLAPKPAFKQRVESLVK